MRNVLEHADRGEVRIGHLIDTLAVDLGLSEAERNEVLPSGKQTVFANRVHWAKTYLKQAELVKPTRRAHFVITARGRAALADKKAVINNAYLKKFDEFLAFQSRNSDQSSVAQASGDDVQEDVTPDEALRVAHRTHK